MKFLAALLIIGSTQFAHAKLSPQDKKTFKAIDEVMSQKNLSCEGSIGKDYIYKLSSLIEEEKTGGVTDIVVSSDIAKAEIVIKLYIPDIKIRHTLIFSTNKDITDVESLDYRILNSEKKKVRRNVGTLISPKYETVLVDDVVESMICK